MSLRTILIPAALAVMLPAGAGAQTLSVSGNDEYGAYIVGPEGRPVYAFVTDERAGDGLPPLQSCKRRCRDDWPPVAVTQEPELGPEIDESLVDTVETDELRVLAYNGHPLFYFHKDAGEGEPQGQQIHTYGGWWYLVAPDGEPIQTGVLPDTDG
jgi:predicted lipoprotein with Yx(FWY)xxD motif